MDYELLWQRYEHAEARFAKVDYGGVQQWPDGKFLLLRSNAQGTSPSMPNAGRRVCIQ